MGRSALKLNQAPTRLAPRKSQAAVPGRIRLIFRRKARASQAVRAAGVGRPLPPTLASIMKSATVRRGRGGADAGGEETARTADLGSRALGRWGPRRVPRGR